MIKRGHFWERFWSKVAVADSGCWEWTANAHPVGYGKIKTRRGTRGVTSLAHRVAYAMTTGPVPADMLVCHTCDNPRCVKPEHLFLGTHLDNNRDRNEKGRSRPLVGDAHHTRRRPELRVRGDRHGRRKLHSSQVVVIKERLRNGEKQCTLADEYAVSRSTINEIAMGRHWSHI